MANVEQSRTLTILRDTPLSRLMPGGSLARWLQSLRRSYFLDRLWARMSVPDPAPVVDGLMEAMAKVRRMTFVTRNTADVERTGIEEVGHVIKKGV